MSINDWLIIGYYFIFRFSFFLVRPIYTTMAATLNGANDHEKLQDLCSRNHKDQAIWYSYYFNLLLIHSECFVLINYLFKVFKCFLESTR